MSSHEKNLSISTFILPRKRREKECKKKAETRREARKLTAEKFYDEK